MHINPKMKKKLMAKMTPEEMKETPAMEKTEKKKGKGKKSC